MGMAQDYGDMLYMEQVRPLSGQISYYRPLILCCDATMTFLMVFLGTIQVDALSTPHMLDRDLTLELLSIFKVFEIIVDESAREIP